MGSKRVRTVLCLAGDGVALCRVASQQGHGFLLSAKTVSITRQSEEGFLGKGIFDALRRLDSKELKKVHEVLLTSSFTNHLQLELYHTRSEHFLQSARYELQHLFNGKDSRLKFELYRNDDETSRHVFFLKEEKRVLLEKNLSIYGIKQPRFLSATALFTCEIERQKLSIDDFKRQISLVLDKEAINFLEPFLPALLLMATGELSSLFTTIDLKKDTEINAQNRDNRSLLKGAIAIGACLGILSYSYAWSLQNRYTAVRAEVQHLSQKKKELEGYKNRIEDAQLQLQAIQERTIEVAIPWNQNRAWCQFFNQLKQRFDAAGDVYLTSMQWHTETLQGQIDRKQKRLTKNPPKSKKNATTNKPKLHPVKRKKDESSTEKNVKKMQSSLKCSGVMYIGDLAIQGQKKEEYNRRFNKLFQSIAQLPDCSEVTSIKMHPPQQGIIAFDFTIKLSPQSKLLGQ